MTETINTTEKHVKYLVVDSSVLIRRAPIKVKKKTKLIKI